MGIQINFGKDQVMFIAVFCAIIISIGLIAAYDSGQPDVHGHDANEIANIPAGGGGDPAENVAAGKTVTASGFAGTMPTGLSLATDEDLNTTTTMGITSGSSNEGFIQVDLEQTYSGILYAKMGISGNQGNWKIETSDDGIIWETIYGPWRMDPYQTTTGILHPVAVPYEGRYIRAGVMDLGLGVVGLRMSEFIALNGYGAIGTGGSGGSCSYGDWVDRSGDLSGGVLTDGPATADGLVLALGSSISTSPLIKTDGSATPTTVRSQQTVTGAGQTYSVYSPVKQGDYWRVENVNTVYWIPLECEGGSASVGGYTPITPSYQIREDADGNVPNDVWTTLDLPPEIGTDNVVVYILANPDTANRWLIFRPYGSTDEYFHGIYVEGANTVHGNGMAIVPTSGGKVDIRQRDYSNPWDLWVIGYMG